MIQSGNQSSKDVAPGTVIPNWVDPNATQKKPTITPGTINEGDSEYVKTQKEIEARRSSELGRLDEAANERQKLYDQMMTKSDDAHKSLLSSIKSSFDATRAKMVDTNSRFNARASQNQYLINGFRYTPQQSEGMVYDTEQYGLQKLGEIDGQYAAALNAAQTAKDERDYKNLGDLMTNLDNLAKDRLNVLKDMAT